MFNVATVLLALGGLQGLPYPGMAHPFTLSLQHVNLDGELSIVKRSKPRADPHVWAWDEVLVLKSPGNSRSLKTITRIEQLEGRGYVSSSAAALELCRLRTFPGTFNLFGDCGAVMLELMSRSQWLGSFRYGLPDWSLRCFEDSDISGVLEESRFTAASVAPPEVEHNGDGYLVERTVVVFDLKGTNGRGPDSFIGDPTHLQFLRICEAVGPFASYRIVRKRALPRPKGDWIFQTATLPRYWSFGKLYNKQPH